MAGRRGCWCRICICGRAPSGSAGSGCWTPTSRASGRAWAITTTATRGASSGSGATETEVAMTSSNLWTDGNALAGPLQDIFRVDVTAAVGGCGNCGRTGPMAEVRVFDHAPGVVARCSVCDQVLLRLAGPARPDLPAVSRTRRDLSVTIADRHAGDGRNPP